MRRGFLGEDRCLGAEGGLGCDALTASVSAAHSAGTRQGCCTLPSLPLRFQDQQSAFTRSSRLCIDHVLTHPWSWGLCWLGGRARSVPSVCLAGCLFPINHRRVVSSLETQTVCVHERDIEGDRGAMVFNGQRVKKAIFTGCCTCQQDLAA